MLQFGRWCSSLLCCALACGLPLGLAAQEAQRSTGAVTEEAVGRGASLSVATLSTSSELPDSPGSVRAQTPDASPTNPSSQAGTSSIQQSPAPQDQTPQRPVGTAAAEAPKVSGITAAQPAGIAIAPAKQRRTRTIVIKVAAIIAAGAAVGTVIALSEATSSKPPGAH
jgi:hypothetical protein